MKTIRLKTISAVATSLIVSIVLSLVSLVPDTRINPASTELSFMSEYLFYFGYTAFILCVFGLPCSSIIDLVVKRIPYKFLTYATFGTFSGTICYLNLVNMKTGIPYDALSALFFSLLVICTVMLFFTMQYMLIYRFTKNRANN